MKKKKNFCAPPPACKYLKHFCCLRNDKILDGFKFKDIAEDKIYVTQKRNFIFGRVENIVGEGEIAGTQHFLLFRP